MKKFLSLVLFLWGAVLLIGCKHDPIEPADELQLIVVDSTEMLIASNSELQDLLLASQPQGALDSKFMQEFTEGVQSAWDNAKAEGLMTEAGWPIISFKVEYPSTLDNVPYWLSGRIYYNPALRLTKGRVKGFVLMPHYTMGSNEECPSKKATQAALYFLSRNFAVLMPDYLGYGRTAGNPHPYLCAEKTAQATYDMLKYTLPQAAEWGWTNSENTKLIRIVGYSQGGHAAVATARLIEQRYSDKFPNLLTYAGGGPYDLLASYRYAVSKDETGLACAIPMIILGMQTQKEAYKTAWKMDELFVDPLKTHYNEWILHKAYTTTEIDEKLGKSRKLSQLLTPKAMDEKDPVTAQIVQELIGNSIVSQGKAIGDWVPRSPIFVFHSSDDEVVPRENADNFIAYLKSKGVKYEAEIRSRGSHGAAGYLFFDDVCKSMK